MNNGLADNGSVDGNQCLSDNSVKIMQPELQIRRPVGLRRHLQRLAGSLGLEKSNKDMLKSMFSSCTSFVPVYDSKFQCEIVFSFWGFVKRDDARFKLLDFLIWLMHPRMY
jgi:hypothetical protein